MDEQTEEFMERFRDLTMAAADLKLYDVAANLSFLQSILIGARKRRDDSYLNELTCAAEDISARALNDLD